MPLRKGKSRAAFSYNVGELIRAGHPKAQALAIAYKTADEGMASYPFPGGPAQGSLSTGLPAKPDANKIFDTWLANLGRAPTAKDREAWSAEAQRQGIDSPDEDRVWKTSPARDEERALATLAKIFASTPRPPVVGRFEEGIGGSAGWAGINLPMPGGDVPAKRQVQPVTFERPEDMNQPLPKKDKLLALDQPAPETSRTAPTGPVRTRKEDVTAEATMFSFPGWPMMNRAAQVSDASKAELGKPGEPQAPQMGAAPGFPFHTRAAERVWTFAQLLILTHPESPPYDILRRAMVEAGLQPTELTPEDMTLLQMAIDMMQNGPPISNVRTGGMPGGPLSVAPHGEEKVRTDLAGLEEFSRLAEVAFSASAYPGPEPGASWSSSMTYPSGIPNSAGGVQPDQTVDSDGEARDKEKADAKRAALRKLAVWVQSRPR